MSTPIPPVRELCVHALHLADYVLDANAISDLFVLRSKALAVKGLINQCYGDLPVTTTRAKTADAGSSPARPATDEDISDLL